MLPELSHSEILRYSRHLLMPEVALDGQRKIKAASVLVIGTGGLGSPIALYLAAAGVGRIGLVDFDVVDYSNLQRQVIHGMAGLDTLKVESARARLLDINPDIEVDAYNEPFTSENAMRIAESYDILIDGTDNFPTRYLTNDVAVLQGKPLVYGSIFRFELTLPYTLAPLAGSAKVVRHTNTDREETTGFGACFLPLADEHEARLQSFIQSAIT